MSTTKSVKGTKTEQYLVNSFAAETQAYARYTFYAQQADKELYFPIGVIFRETAANELRHAKVFLKFLPDVEATCNGGVDAVINDIPVTQAFMAKNPGQVKMVGDSLADDKYGFAVAKGNTELADKISAGLANVKESGVYDELLIKYINGEGAPEAAPADDAEAPADAPADGEKTAE